MHISFKLLLSFIFGIVTAFMLPDYNFIICGFIGFSSFYYLLNNCPSGKYAFLCGWLFGFGYFLMGLYWIGNALLIEGNPYRWAYPIAVIGLPFILSFYFGLTSFLIKKFTDLSKISGFLFFVFLFGIEEFLRGHLFTGFPWNLIAFGWSEHITVIQILNIIGVYGLTFLSILWFSFVGFICVNKLGYIKKSSLLFVVILSFLASFYYGYSKIEKAKQIETPLPNITIALVQANIPQSKKWDTSLIIDNFMKYVNLSKGISHDEKYPIVIIWPETSLHFALFENKRAREEISNLLKQFDSEAYLVTGALIESNKEFSNDIVVFDKNAQIVDIYSKSHLVPFGEYVPFKEFFELTPISNFNGLKAGNGVRDIKISNKLPPFSPLICYEIIFSGDILQNNSSADWIVNVTNDAWYGDSSGPYQHLAQAKFRAIEEEKTTVRAASTGISAIIDRYGNILNRIELNKKDIIKKNMHLRLGNDAH